MYNYMNCNQMIIGRKVKYCIQYKTNQTGFDIYRRKNIHNTMVQANDKNLEGQVAVNFNSDNVLLVSETDKVVLYDSFTLKKLSEI